MGPEGKRKKGPVAKSLRAFQEMSGGRGRRAEKVVGRNKRTQLQMGVRCREMKQAEKAKKGKGTQRAGITSITFGEAEKIGKRSRDEDEARGPIFAGAKQSSKKRREPTGALKRGKNYQTRRGTAEPLGEFP